MFCSFLLPASIFATYFALANCKSPRSTKGHISETEIYTLCDTVRKKLSILNANEKIKNEKMSE